jgi:hypothetical protein
MVCLLLEGHRVEEQAFWRAQAKLVEEIGSESRNLDSITRRAIFAQVSNRSALSARSVQEVSFSEAKTTIESTVRSLPLSPLILAQFRGSPVTVSIVSPTPLPALECAIALYLSRLQRPSGLVHRFPQPMSLLARGALPRTDADATQTLSFPIGAEGRLNQSIGYLVGAIPNAGSQNEPQSDQTRLFRNLLLRVTRELIDQRLFEVVREEEHLTYAASLSYLLREGVFIISAPSSTHPRALAAIEACKRALSSLRREVTPTELSGYISRIRHSLLTEAGRGLFWLDALHNTEKVILQCSSFPLRSLASQTVPSWSAVNEALSKITPQVQLPRPRCSSPHRRESLSLCERW